MADIAALQSAIDAAFEDRANIGPSTTGPSRAAVEEALSLLDQGKLRVAEKGASGWTVNQWLKKAVLLSFRLNPMAVIKGGPGEASWWDKVPSKFDGWGPQEFEAAGFRAVPNCIVRRSAYIAPGVVLMPSFVNLGAYVDEGTMVDTWATVGSCAQIGKNCHISGGAGIGGVLEPLQAGPVIIEDNCFIGARAEVAEGVIVGEGSVLSMGVYLGASTKIVDRATGEIHMGRVPPYSVVVSGALPGKPLPNNEPGPSLYCAVIVKRVDEKTRAKTSINELLRD
jgi:2,3,4,5-tetrahydropyridine-2-carboxylate N-succinyltransferase